MLAGLMMLVMPPVTRLVTAMLVTPDTDNCKVEFVILKVVRALAGEATVFESTRRPLVMVMTLLVLADPTEIVLARTVPLRMFRMPVVLCAAMLAWVVLARTRLLLTIRVAFGPLTLTIPSRGVLLVLGP